jgi:hypothetical protein
MGQWNVHNPEKASKYLALNAAFLDMTVGKPVKGRENIKNDVIAYFINACPDCTWTRNAKQTLFGKNKVSYVWTTQGDEHGGLGQQQRHHAGDRQGVQVLRSDVHQVHRPRQDPARVRLLRRSRLLRPDGLVSIRVGRTHDRQFLVRMRGKTPVPRSQGGPVTCCPCGG